MPAADLQLVMCAVCALPSPRTHYWGDTTLCDECGLAWETSGDCQQRSPGATPAQCEAVFAKWCDAARARLKRKGPDVSHCSTCKAEVYWAVNPATGKSNPIDVAPSPKGNVLLSYRPRSGRLEATYITKDTPLATLEGRRRFLSHFVDCPQAAQHRRTA